MFCLYIVNEKIKSLDVLYISAHKVYIGVTLSASCKCGVKEILMLKFDKKAKQKMQNASYLGE